MVSKTVTKLFFLFITSTILASCVNNKDQEKVKPIEDPIDLTMKALDGKWEVYFFNKRVIPVATNIESRYRNTEFDGFTVTFTEDGTFYENNIFGHRNREGKYLIGNYADDDTIKIWQTGPLPNKKKNAIFMSYITEKEKINRLPKAEIPAMFDDHFAFRDKYTGITKGLGLSYNVEDIRYYRNMEKAPNYMPDEKDFKKNVLKMSDLLGRWEFYNYFIIIDHLKHEAPPDIVADYGQQYLFRIVNGKQEFHEYLKGRPNEPYRSGEFIIIDDVVNIFAEKTDGSEEEKEWKSFKLWVKEAVAVNNAGKKMIRSYDKFLDINDELKEKEQFDFFQKVSDK